MKLRVLPEAEAEYRAAAEWYNARQAGVGDEFLDVVAETLERIAEDPDRFPWLETMRSASPTYRRVVLRRFPYLVVYRILNEEVLVVAVAHAHRKSDYWRKRSP